MESKEIFFLIPEGELDTLLCRFFIGARKKDGKNYEQDSLSTFHQGIKRYLDDHNYGANILQDTVFEKSRNVLAAKRKELTKLGHGNRPNARRELSTEEAELLFNDGYFGTQDPQSLLNAMWWICSLHFGYRARHEARKLALAL